MFLIGPYEIFEKARNSLIFRNFTRYARFIKKLPLFRNISHICTEILIYPC